MSKLFIEVDAGKEQPELVIEVYLKGKLFGLERLTDKGWEWMCYELNPDVGERWVMGVMSASTDITRTVRPIQQQEGLAIEFADWMGKNYCRKTGGNLWCMKKEYFTTSELFKEFINSIK